MPSNTWRTLGRVYFTWVWLSSSHNSLRRGLPKYIYVNLQLRPYVHIHKNVYMSFFSHCLIWLNLPTWPKESRQKSKHKLRMKPRGYVFPFLRCSDSCLAAVIQHIYIAIIIIIIVKCKILISRIYSHRDKSDSFNNVVLWWWMLLFMASRKIFEWGRVVCKVLSRKVICVRLKSNILKLIMQKSLSLSPLCI